MTLVALITDIHIGVRGDSSHFHDSNEKFFKNVFFPKLKNLGITTILHGGDLFDKQASINLVSLKRAREYLFDPMGNAGLKMISIIGNHDISLKNTNDVNSPNLVLRDYDNIVTVSEATNGPYGFLLLPWINKENYDQSMSMVANTSAKHVLAHLELKGFSMYKGLLSGGGMDSSPFKRFENVYTGHFHHRSRVGNIEYIGAAGEHRWSDYDDWRGFHIFDTDTGKIVESIENPYKMYAKVNIDGPEELVKYRDSDIIQSFITLNVNNVDDGRLLNAVKKSIEAKGAVEVNINELRAAAVDEDGKEISVEIETIETQTFFERYLNKIEGLRAGQKERVSILLNRLFQEAEALNDKI